MNTKPVLSLAELKPLQPQPRPKRSQTTGW